MKRVTKRAVLVGVAALLTALSLATAVPAAANTSCSNGADSFCSEERRAIISGGYTNPTIFAERGIAQTNIGLDSATQAGFDANVANDRVRGR